MMFFDKNSRGDFNQFRSILVEVRNKKLVLLCNLLMYFVLFFLLLVVERFFGGIDYEFHQYSNIKNHEISFERNNSVLFVSAFVDNVGESRR
jgi:hypothetical protein